MITYRIRALDAETETTGFRCGHVALDDYLGRHAGQNVRKNIARVFVATPADAPRRIAGFFALSAGSVACSDLPAEFARKLPLYPMPVALLGRLAVDVEFQGTGLGSLLLADACSKVMQASAVLAVTAVVVDARDERAVAFYKHFGFVPLPGQSNRLFIATARFARKRRKE